MKSTSSLLIFVTVFCASLAFAQTSAEPCPSYVPPETADASTLSLRGVACFEAGEFLRALMYYRQAYGISKSAVLRAGIGRSLQELGQPDLARQYYEAYLQVASPQTDGYQKIEQRLSDLLTSLKTNASTVEITSIPADAEVFVVLDGQYWERLGATPVKMKMLPGKYRIVVQKTDFMTREETIEVGDDGDDVSVDVEMVSQAALFNVSSRTWQRRGVYLMLGSIPLLLGGGGLFIIGQDRIDEANQLAPEPGSASEANRLRDQGHTLRTVAIGTTAGGAALAITGLIFYLAGDSTSGSAAYPVIGPNQLGFAGTF
ncbi:MAG: PEGA domain-containing protein [bacterium]